VIQVQSHFDVIIVGAGISGIGAAYHLKTMSPDRSFQILEGRANFGGTWDLFRYPGVRSDSDMHTLGYKFKPWTADKSIADGPAILEYLRETIAENNLDEKIRYNQHVTKAEWSTLSKTWTLSVLDKISNTENKFSCNFLFMCSGYYSYKQGFTPQFEGIQNFKGEVVHPQFWPQDLDYRNKRVVVIGSGATAMTLVPAMAKDVAKITMLQRSPTYVVSRPSIDPFAKKMRRLLPEKLAYKVTRFKNTTMQQIVYRRTRVKPLEIKELLLSGVRAELGPDYDVAKHFTPTYNPWDQRLCLVPDSDLFKAIRSGKAEVVTDTIKDFSATGIELDSGQHLDADIIVTATGLNLVTLGEMEFVVDSQLVDFSKTWTYKGFAFSGIPNLASSWGYINASWTLRADLTCEIVCRLLNHMRDTKTSMCTPTLRVSDRGMPQKSWIESFSSGYMRRAMHKMPKQGDREPWINPQNYKRDKKMFRKSPVDDGVMLFAR
jgi:cation diffusion facilitator CzcD-associated flavoprotein CzcO